MDILSRFRFPVALMLAMSIGFSSRFVDAQDAISTTDNGKLPIGLVKTRPSSDPYVEIDGYFMVPYTASIPGTQVTFTMVPIPGGKFTMGSPDHEEDRRDDEGPQFEVVVEPFWMGKYEVTWAEYRKFMQLDKVFKALHGKGIRRITSDNEVDAVTAPSSLYDSTPYLAGGEPSQPAASMTQFAAKQYTKWLSLTSSTFYRLPTEAEWEYACRADTSTAFYFGDDDESLRFHAWLVENSDDERHPVGQLEPNPWGLHDMYGNVAEWVLDQYNEDGYGHVTGGNSVTVQQAFAKPTKLFPRVIRGGSFELEPEDCRSAARIGSEDKDWKIADPNFPKSPWWFTDFPAFGVGFRIVRPLVEPNSREVKNTFWDADVESIVDDAKNRIIENGRGAFGAVDANLPDDISRLTDADK